MIYRTTVMPVGSHRPDLKRKSMSLFSISKPVVPLSYMFLVPETLSPWLLKHPTSTPLYVRNTRWRWWARKEAVCPRDKGDPWRQRHIARASRKGLWETRLAFKCMESITRGGGKDGALSSGLCLSVGNSRGNTCTMGVV